MTKIYACLTGNWVCLNDDPDCVVGDYRVPPAQWYKEQADIFAPLKRTKANTFSEMDYVKIFYLGRDYKINPIFLQVVSEE